MKKLFVTHNISNIKIEENENIFDRSSKNSKGTVCPTLKLSENQYDANSSSSITTNSSAESRKYSLNILSGETSSAFDINSPLNSNSTINYIDENKFLGKKIKYHFNIIKDKSSNIKSEFLENQNDNNINLEKNSYFNIEEIKSTKIPHKNNNHREKRCSLNEGRWSFEEHIKFIEALVDYGKNWKDVQKYVGTRSAAQARSHAQKFLLKLKMIKNDEINIDFTNNSIKNLSDVIEVIKSKNENNENERKYIINTLINLSETISYENNSIQRNIKKQRIPNFKPKTKTDKIKNGSITEHNKPTNNIIFNTLFNNGEKEIKVEELKSNKEQNTNKTVDKEKNNNISENNPNKEKIDIIIKNENINLIEEEPLNENNDFYSDFEHNNKKLVICDGIALYLDDFDLWNYNNKLRTNDYYYDRFDYKYNFNKNFFS
jgi:SHAQKYF class myb-like DNA-binding protein